MKRKEKIRFWSFVMRAWVVMMAVVFLQGTTTALAQADKAEKPKSAARSAELSGDYVIGVSDVIEVQVWKEPDLSKTQAVRLDGRISLPLLGDIDAAGKTTSQLAKLIEKELKKVVADPVVTVMVGESKSRRYYIIGQIASPGEFPLDYPLTLSQAIARSGGFLEWADKSEISVIRHEKGEKKIFKFNYDSFVKGKNLEQDVLIAPGDTIVIP